MMIIFWPENLRYRMKSVSGDTFGAGLPSYWYAYATHIRSYNFKLLQQSPHGTWQQIKRLDVGRTAFLRQRIKKTSAYRTHHCIILMRLLSNAEQYFKFRAVGSSTQAFDPQETGIRFRPMWWNSQPQHLLRWSCRGWRRPHTHSAPPLPPIHAILDDEDCELLIIRIRMRIIPHIKLFF